VQKIDMEILLNSSHSVEPTRMLAQPSLRKDASLTALAEEAFMAIE
jgi:hypothetical protein